MQKFYTSEASIDSSNVCVSDTLNTLALFKIFETVTFCLFEQHLFASNKNTLFYLHRQNGAYGLWVTGLCMLQMKEMSGGSKIFFNHCQNKTLTLKFYIKATLVYFSRNISLPVETLSAAFNSTMTKI